MIYIAVNIAIFRVRGSILGEVQIAPRIPPRWRLGSAVSLYDCNIITALQERRKVMCLRQQNEITESRLECEVKRFVQRF